jgi:alanyl-tRNA synthetase
MNSDEIRASFLHFFEGKKHKIIPSSSLIPHGDPTLLLTTAGMVQVKPYFLGLAQPPNPRLASCQKCFRTTDIDEVGDIKHLTFFEMLGNFSVGDYFKREAIQWAWDFITDDLQMDTSRMWVTIFLDDDEAYDIWREIGFPSEKILRFGEEDNFWGPAGDSGPCGPCSEIHYDFGESVGCGKPDCNPGCDCGRFIEVWNLVFTQYQQSKSGERILLPKPNIDTGMGLERVAAVKQGVSTVYDTDMFLPIRDKVSQIAGIKYGKTEEYDNAIRIIAEHSRGIAFLIADGVLPSNEGRGYILRRILRRASYFGRKLGIIEPFVYEITNSVVQKMSHVYPELANNHRFINELVESEEEKFIATLDNGINIVEKLISDAVSRNQNMLAGEHVFKLYDTYGFPLELTSEIASRNGISIDVRGFDRAMEEQREKARTKHKFAYASSESLNLDESVIETEFHGYQNLNVDTEVVYIMDQENGKSIKSTSGKSKLALILDKTPFYGQMGGQVGDTGKLVNESTEIVVTDTVMSPFGGLGEGYHIHMADVIKGEVKIGDKFTAIVDDERRKDIARNHTATHLLQLALRNTLGSHVSQRGSLVSADRLRFDFSHLKNVKKEEISEIQRTVNKLIRENLLVHSEIIDYKEAIGKGAIALFEEKYKDDVRVLSIGEPPVSMELCGGTHVKATGDIGMFIIVSESSIGAGLRRIEAVTGREAENYIENCIDELQKTAGIVGGSMSEVASKARLMVDKLSAESKLVDSLRKETSINMVKDMEARVKSVENINIIAEEIPEMSLTGLRDMGDALRNKLGSGIIVLASVYDNKPGIIMMVTKDLVDKGIKANDLIKEIASFIEGSGGGKPDVAQAGGKKAEKIKDALQAVEQVIKTSLSKITKDA